MKLISPYSIAVLSLVAEARDDGLTLAEIDKEQKTRWGLSRSSARAEGELLDRGLIERKYVKDARNRRKIKTAKLIVTTEGVLYLENEDRWNAALQEGERDVAREQRLPSHERNDKQIELDQSCIRIAREIMAEVFGASDDGDDVKDRNALKSPGEPTTDYFDPKKHPSRIIPAVAEVMGTTAAYIIGSNRDKRATEARRVASFMLVKVCELSYPEAAKQFGKESHGAVHKWVKEFEQQANDKLETADYTYAGVVEAVRSHMALSPAT